MPRAVPSLIAFMGALVIAAVAYPSMAIAAGDVPSCRVSLGYAPAVRVPTGAGPQDVAVGDLDGDGSVDLVVAEAAQMSVHIGRADGSYTLGTAVPVVAHLLAMADLDGDGHLDLVASAHDSASVAVVLGDGGGGFAPAPGSPYAAHDGEPHNHGLAVGDVDGDGALDVVTSNHGHGSVSVLLGDGSGRLVPASGSPIPIDGGPYLLRLADLDGDGDLDIVVPLLETSAVAVLEGDGRGGFQAAAGSPYATSPRPYALLVADLGGDDRADVLVSHDADAMTLLEGGPDGRLHEAEGSPLDIGVRPFDLEAVDLDDDGRLEVVAGAGDRLVGLDARSSESFAHACRTDLTPGGWLVTVADVDQDGRPDLLATDEEGDAVWLWLATGE